MRAEGRSRARAFSQIELMVAVAVLAVGVLGVFSEFALDTRAAGQAARVTEATAWCREIIELMRVRNLTFMWSPSLPPVTSGLNDSPAARVALNAAPFNTDLPAAQNYTRNIRVEPLTAWPGDYRASMLRVTVGVYWTDHGAERKVEFQAYHRQP